MSSPTTERDLSWADAPTPALLRLAGPITVSMLSHAVMTLVDTLFVGRLGSAALAGVSFGGTVAYAMVVFPLGLLVGAKVLVSQAHGAGADRRPFVGAALGLAALMGTLVVLASPFIAQLLPQIMATPESGEAAQAYAGIRLLGAPAFLLFAAMREVRYGVGDSRAPMLATLLAAVLNIVLDYLFIFVAGWGVEGAAAATIAGNAIAAGGLAMVQAKEGFGVLHKEGLRKVWRVGLPSAVQFSMEIASFTTMATLIAALSEVEMAAHQVCLQVVHFGFLPLIGLSEASSVLAGQAMGAGRPELVKKLAFRGLGVGAIYAVVFMSVLFSSAETIAGAFTDSSEVIAKATVLLWVGGAFQLGDAAVLAARGPLRGSGDVRVPALIGVVSAWCCTPPLTYILGYRFGLGALGGWLGITCEIAMSCTIIWWRLLGGSWRSAAEKTRAEIDDPAPAPAQ